MLGFVAYVQMHSFLFKPEQCEPSEPVKIAYVQMHSFLFKPEPCEPLEPVKIEPVTLSRFIPPKFFRCEVIYI